MNGESGKYEDDLTRTLSYDGTLTICDPSYNVILEKDDIKSVEEKISNGQKYIELTLSHEGQEKFAEATKEISKSNNNCMYILQDEIVICQPIVTQEINSDTVLISI